MTLNIDLNAEKLAEIEVTPEMIGRCLVFLRQNGFADYSIRAEDPDFAKELLEFSFTGLTNHLCK
jgi:hypothetical protein